jgi:hypothetical protein
MNRTCKNIASSFGTLLATKDEFENYCSVDCSIELIPKIKLASAKLLARSRLVQGIYETEMA